MKLYTLIWNETYGECAFLGIFRSKEAVKEAAIENIKERDFDDKYSFENIIEDEYIIIPTEINKEERKGIKRA